MLAATGGKSKAGGRVGSEPPAWAVILVAGAFLCFGVAIYAAGFYR